MSRFAASGARFLVRTLARAALRALAGPWVWWRYRPRLHGRLPATPALLTCNHAAFADTVLLAVLLRAPFVIVGAHPRLYRTWVRRALLSAADVVRAEGPAMAEAKAVEALGAGRWVLVYPEGGRRPRGLGPFTTVAARAAHAAGVSIVPMYLYGTSEGHRSPAWLAIGPPIDADADADAVTARLRAAITALAEGGVTPCSG